MGANTIHDLAALLVAGTVAFSVGLSQASAQDIPTDTQIQAAFGVAYNHLGLMQYCAAKKFASAADVANTRKVLDATITGMDVSPTARAQQAVGQHGNIIGRQLIGLMDPQSSTHPEMVPEGQTVSLADNAHAQHTSERTLCRQMAAQAAPLR
ncbi:MAG: hypothetical protein ACRYG8_34660 [Janthinobacterium lividum]